MDVSIISVTANPLETLYKAARRCYSEDSGIPKEADPASMSKLVKRCMRSGHTSILEHVSFTFHIDGISRACSHQLVRHRMASYAQQSQRYADAQQSYVTPPSMVRDANLHAAYVDVMKKAFEAYSALVELGVPKEDARYLLPQASATSIVVTMNARELRENFFPLRLCLRAQWEIRQVAFEMLSRCRCLLPQVFDDAGARCDILGYCPETNGCGRRKPLPKEIIDEH